MKILMIHPQNTIQRFSNKLYGKPVRYAAITMPTLANITPTDLNIEVEVIDEMVSNLDLNHKTDLVAITAITSAAPRAYEIAKHFRKRNIPVIMGGVHATLVPDEVKNHVDTVVVGYAEKLWPLVVKDFIAGNLQKHYGPDKTFSANDIITPDRKYILNHRYVAPHTIEMSRGCNNRCEFCVSHQFHGEYTLKNMDQVLGEIKNIKGKMISFLDPNLIGDLAYAKEFFTRMIPLKKWWVGCTTIEVANHPELLDVIKKSGCKGLLIGFETLNQQALDESNKSFNQVSNYKQAVKLLHSKGIIVEGTFVLGFDSDTKEVFDEVSNFIIDNKIDLAQITVYTPFPGTMAYDRLKGEGRIIDDNWENYNAQKVVFTPKNMTPIELEDGLRYVWNKTYSYKAIFKRLFGPPFLAKPVILFSNIYLKLFMKKILNPIFYEKIHTRKN